MLAKALLSIGISLLIFSGSTTIYLGVKHKNNRKGFILLLYGFTIYLITFASLIWLIPKLV